MLDHRQHLNSLDGVRGLAILMVFCHHLCPFAGGNPVAVVCSTLWLGVDLFFALSGFLITGVLYDTMEQPGFFGNFYARRALRLLPIYCVIVVLVLAANAIMGGSLTIWALPYFAYASNIVRDAALPIGVVQKLDVSHFWSLAVEEQFYLFWPLAMCIARTRHKILSLCIVATAVSVALRFLTAAHHAPGSHFILGTPYFELPMRLDSLLLGGALAMLLRTRRGVALLTTERLNMVFIAGMVALALSFAASEHGSMFAKPTVRYGYFAAAISFTALIGLAAKRGSWAARLGNTTLLRLFGRCSYSLYLIHLIPRYWYYQALTWAQAQCGSGIERDAVSVGVFLLYLFLCFVIATLSYRYLERYFLKMKIRFRYIDEHGELMRDAAYAD